MLLHGNRRKWLLFLNLSRCVEVRLAEIALGCRPRRRVARKSLGRQAGGEVLRALYLATMAVVIHLFLGVQSADGFRTSLCRLAIGALLAVAQPAAGAEPHSAPATGKTSVTHNK